MRKKKKRWWCKRSSSIQDLTDGSGNVGFIYVTGSSDTEHKQESNCERNADISSPFFN